ncbi:Holliday junction branch migration protein RuvA [Tessaracoccus rhinocerotis]|uniref:Holliday junction branch migration complex subunit RuvA n=1 Tax=Tessaracoccus rhinocerotis TaxID=1689449 RepID=A0A553JY49_9ACTN|nr:Holliday junction branch migration protein RuvA [Tessaracoccus rhinocerotis]TRY17377.1 Holliday junction branch migration protein RuvA [Tessaracoccus rhinocerotis]
MIAQLTGTVLQAGATQFVLEVGGVGYLVHTTPATAAAVRPGETSTIHTSMVVREDSLTLYGFQFPGEREAFELVQTASGVGPRLAAAIVSVLSPAEIRRAVNSEDLNRLCSVPGIGRKGAQKLVIELKDKVLLLPDDESGAAAAPQSSTRGEAWREQVGDGLQGLGWSARDAAAACDNVAHLVDEDPGIAIGTLMRAALNSLARK